MIDGSSEEPRVLELRKYPNRRYYDTTRSRHVTLEEIQALVREGYAVHVTDSKSGEDITGKVLTHIILELDTPKLDMFPVPLLHRLIQANEELIHDFMDKYFNQAVLSFLDSQRQFEQYLRQTMKMQTAGPAMAEWAKFMLVPFGAASKAGGVKPEQTAAEDPAELRAAIEELSQQMEELRRELSRERQPHAKKPGGK